jgi:acyl-CoA dehydrogenase
VIPVIEELKEIAKAQGLWNLFMPPHSGQSHVDDTFKFEGTQLTNLEYALCAEEMGKIKGASECFNCPAPDTGNIGSAAVASSDATNIETSIVRDGNHYVINGRKWWSSGTGDPCCAVGIVMGKTNPNAKRHPQRSQILVLLDAPGVPQGRRHDGQGGQQIGPTRNRDDQGAGTQHGVADFG